MYNAFAVDDDPDLIGAHAEKVRRLDKLKAFVHQRGAVDGYLLPHAPRGMSQRLRGCHALKLRSFFTVKGTARSGYYEAFYLAVLACAKALVYRAVFAVHRSDIHTALTRAAHNDLSGNDERFLVCKRKMLAAFYHRKRGVKSRISDY